MRLSKVQRRKHLLRCLILLIALTVMAAAALTLNRLRPRTPLRIDRETTWLTEPLRADGTVNYAEALRRQAAAGITVDNNAAVVIRRAFGPLQDQSELPKWYYDLLQINPLPSVGDYFVPLARVVSEKYPNSPGYAVSKLYDIQDQLAEAKSRVWTREEFPFISEWYDRNQAPLQLAMEASKRTRFLSLPLGPDEPLISVRAWDQQAVRDLVDLIALRITRSLADGLPDEAWEQSMACHRLSRLVDQGPTELDGLIAYNVEITALKCDIAIAAHTGFSSDRLQDCRRYIQQLEPFAPMLDRINLFSRLVVLDMNISLANNRFEADDGDPWWLQIPLRTEAHDWNIGLRLVNQRFDQLVAALSLPTRQARDDAAAIIIQQVRDAFNRMGRQEFSVWLSAMLGTAAFPTLTANCTLNLTLDSSANARNSVERVAAHRQLAITAFSLAAFRRDHDRYPDVLEELVPKYAESIPDDPYSQSPLIYTHEESEFVLYSIGPNRIDDGGWNSMEWGDSGDDLVVRFPM